MTLGKWIQYIIMITVASDLLPVPGGEKSAKQPFLSPQKCINNLYTQSNGPNAPDVVTFLSFLPKVKKISGFLGNFCRCQSNSHENAGCSKLSDVCLIFCETQTQYCRKGTQNKPQTTMHMHRAISLPRPLSCHTRILKKKNTKAKKW